MKAKDLIEKLQKLDSNAEIITRSSNLELKGAEVAVSFVHQYNTGNKTTRIFKDAFDLEFYESEVWSITGGHIPVVLIS